MVQVPLSGKSLIMGAYRQTYYQLYDPTSIRGSAREQQASGNGLAGNRLDFEVQPAFVFRDANLKYVYRGTNKSRLSFSLYYGGDQFQYDMEGQLTRTILRRGEKETNRQLGSSVQYSYPWQNGDATNVTLAYSAFNRQLFERNETENQRFGAVRTRREVDSENSVDELTLNAEHTLNFKRGHRLLVGAGAINNHVQLSRFWNEDQVIDIDNQSPRFYAYLQDELPITKSLELKTGVRSTYVTELKNWHIEPRISASLAITGEIKLNAAWGMYNQFLSKTTVVDSAYNFSRFWTNADENQVPVLSAEHYVAGISFNKNGFTFSSEAYYKTTDGLSRFFNREGSIEHGFYKGKAKTKGLDVFVKKEYKRQVVWVSYTLNDTQEHFLFYLRDEWQPAPQQQKHELKVAGIFNYRSFYFSANYIYGSGFERFDNDAISELEFDNPYKRLDASVVYKFKPGKVKVEAGISVLNVLDNNNVKYSNIGISTIDEVNLVRVYSDAVPFTPALFFKIEF